MLRWRNGTSVRSSPNSPDSAVALIVTSAPASASRETGFRMRPAGIVTSLVPSGNAAIEPVTG